MAAQLIDVGDQYAPLSYSKPTEATDQQKILPPYHTVPGTTWDVAAQVRDLLLKKTARENFFMHTSIHPLGPLLWGIS